MKKILNVLLFVGLLMPLMVSCSSDDEEVDDIKSYIVGKWHSYRITAYYEGESKSVNVSKTGEYADMYIELTFNQDGTMSLYSWLPNSSGTEQWVEQKGTYSIKEDIVSLIDEKGDVDDLVFDRKAKTMCLQASTTYIGSTMKMNIYFKK